MKTSPADRRSAGSSRADRLAFALLALALLAGAVAWVVLGGVEQADAVDLEVVERGPRAAEATQTPVDPGLEARIAEDVVAFVNAERRANSMPLLSLLEDEHVRTANEARLREATPEHDLADVYGGDAVTARELHVRLGTGTRSGEAVAGWLASAGDRDVLLDRAATGIAVAAACQPGERGGDLVLTVHVVDDGEGPGEAGPIGDDRPGAGRGEACQFAELATGPTAEEGVLVPAALTLAATVAAALGLLEWQRRHHRPAPRRVRRRDGDDPDGRSRGHGR
ncbi:hypothetical protein [Egicoccus sp. AB-alg2]|uniref:hypothetical protein n=1 Tax=Egicoccus sp. AB-alg2 TaxID=3242693 RepID=UPI00359D5898